MSDDKLKENRETIRFNLKKLDEFEAFLRNNLPESQYVIYSLEYIKNLTSDQRPIWDSLYDLHMRISDLKVDNQKLQKRLKALEDNGL